MTTKELIVSLMDLTSLNDDDHEMSIRALAAQSTNNLGSVASVCVYKKFISTLKPLLPSNIKITTVANFPHGSIGVATVINEIKTALLLGADEIDIVIPYHEYLKLGSSSLCCNLIRHCKDIIHNKTLKVILETGELKTEDLIRKAAIDAINNGADFIKTSTGTTEIGATLEAATYMLEEIKKSTNKKVGFKASGGIKTYKQAISYLNLAKTICGEHFITPQTFRFGVSSLLNNLLNVKSASKSEDY